MADLDQLERIDDALAQEGTWTPYKADIELRIARASNPRSLKLLRELAAGEYRARLRVGGTIAAEASNEMSLHVLAETILLDWRNLSVGGEALTRTPETALRVLREFPELRRFVGDFSMELEPYRLRTDEDGQGNSAAPSGGTAGGARMSAG